MENWKLFLNEHLRTIKYDDVVNATGQGIFAVIHYLQAYEAWLEKRAADTMKQKGPHRAGRKKKPMSTITLAGFLL